MLKVAPTQSPFIFPAVRGIDLEIGGDSQGRTASRWPHEDEEREGVFSPRSRGRKSAGLSPQLTSCVARDGSHLRCFLTCAGSAPDARGGARPFGEPWWPAPVTGSRRVGLLLAQQGLAVNLRHVVSPGRSARWLKSSTAGVLAPQELTSATNAGSRPPTARACSQAATALGPVFPWVAPRGQSSAWHGRGS